uniref:Transposase n=1 Tax=Elaeophora elaphi TaxID=1147741 RepID=A0A0R3RTV0_9BILA
MINQLAIMIDDFHPVHFQKEASKMGSAVSIHQQLITATAGRVATTTAITKTLSEKITSKQIDKQLEKEKLENTNIFKILLLGKF